MSEYAQAFNLVRDAPAADSTIDGFLLRLRRSMGHAFAQGGETDSALEIFRDVAEDAKLRGERDLLRGVLSDLSSAYFQLGQADSSIRYAVNAREILGGSDAPTRLRGATLLRIAESYGLSTTPKHAALAVLYYDSAAAVYQVMRRTGGSDAVRRQVGTWEHLLYSKWAAVYLTRQTGADSVSRFYAALAAADRGRAAALADAMEPTFRYPELGADMALEGRQLVASAIRQGEALLYYLVVPKGLAIWYVGPDGNVQVFFRSIESRMLHSSFEMWRDALGVSRSPRTEEQSSADPKVTAPKSSDAAKLGRLIAQTLLPPELYELPRPPLSSRIRRLVIVGHAFVQNLPFVALPLRDNEYLGESIAIELQPSLRVASALARRHDSANERDVAGSAPEDVLILGDPDFPRCWLDAHPCFNGSALPYARGEAVAVGKIIGASPFVGKDASESILRSRLSRARLVHLAVHGEGVATSGLDDPSRLWLARTGLSTDETVDGPFSASELLASSTEQLKASLVVLSACESLVGSVQVTEGAVSLARAFLARGAQAVVASLWKVDDAATARVMESFYRHWLEDPDTPPASEALRRATLDVRKLRVGLLRRRKYDAPRYWAAFQVIGQSPAASRALRARE
jgi:CHAT domain-containing protein